MKVEFHIVALDCCSASSDRSAFLLLSPYDSELLGRRLLCGLRYLPFFKILSLSSYFSLLLGVISSWNVGGVGVGSRSTMGTTGASPSTWAESSVSRLGVFSSSIIAFRMFTAS